MQLVDMDLVDDYRDFSVFPNSDIFVISLKKTLLFY